MKYVKSFLIGVIIGAIIMTALWIKFLPNPTEPQIITVKEPVVSGSISGQTTIPQPIEPGQIVNPDFKAVIPVKGEFATENAEVKVSGETIIEKIGDQVSADTKFYDAEIKVKYKPPPKKSWHIGAYVVTDLDEISPGGFIQRDFPVLKLGPVDVVTFGRIEVDYDTRLMAGVQLNF